MLWLNYFISNKYQVYNTVQYIKFIMKLELERNRKLIGFSYNSVHFAMEGGLYYVNCFCSQYVHTLTCQVNLIFMSEHTEGKMP